MSWKNCTSCRKGIELGAVYWECSVSTCNSKRMGLYFCTVACWDAHLPGARHREAWAVEKRAPTSMQDAESAEPRASAPAPLSRPASGGIAQPARRTVSAGPSAGPSAAPRAAPSAAPSAAPTSSRDDDELLSDVLVVVSKLKKYVKARSEMNTSDSAIPVLSQELRRICDRAIRIAGENGRKTIMDRDVRDALKQ